MDVVVVSQKEVNSASLKGLRYLIIKLRKIINWFTIIVIILIKVVVVIIERLNMKLIIAMVITTTTTTNSIILTATAAAIIKIAGLTITELIAFACSNFGGESINWFAVEICEQN